MTGQPPHVFLGPFEIAEHTPRAFEHAAAGGGEHHAPAEPHEQRRAEPPFDVAQLVAEGRLRQMQAGGRAGHGAGVGDPGDQLQMPDFEVHGRHSSI